jgi:hypothetical protein
VTVLSQSVRREERAERTFRVRDLPPIVEYRRGYGTHFTDVWLYVDRITLIWVNGRFRTAKLEGRRTKSNGEPGRAEGCAFFSAHRFTPEQVEAKHDGTPPSWLVELVKSAREPSMEEVKASGE